MSRNQRYQCTYSRCSAFFKNGKIYEVCAALVDAKNQEYIHAITDDQGQLWRFYKMGCGTELVYSSAGGGAFAAFSYVGGGMKMILTCHGSDLDCFEDGCQYEAEKPGGLPKNQFLVVTDTYGHLWYAAPSKARGWWLIQNDDREVVVAFKQDE